MVTMRNPLFGKLMMFAKLNYLLSCYHIQPNKQRHANLQFMYHKGV